MEPLGYVHVGESVDKLNGFGRAVLPMLKEEYLGKTFFIYGNEGNYMLKELQFIAETSPFKELYATIIDANSRDIALEINGGRFDFKKFSDSLHSFHASKSIEDIFDEEVLEKAS